MTGFTHRRGARMLRPSHFAMLLTLPLAFALAPRATVAQQEAPLGSELERPESDAIRFRSAPRPRAGGTYMYSFDLNRSCARLGIAFESGDQPVVRDVMPGSAAQDAGVRPGDRLLRLDGETATAARIEELAEELEPGDRVRLLVERDGRERTMDVEARADMCSYRRMFTHEPHLLRCARGDSTEVEAELRCQEFAMREVRELRERALKHMDGARMREMAEQLRHAMEEMPRFEFTPADSGMWMRFHLDSIAPDSLFFDIDSVRVATERALLALDSIYEGIPPVIVHADSLRRLLPLRRVAPPAQAMRAHALMLRNLEIGMHAIAGAHLTELNPDLAGYFEVDAGVLVTEVAPGSPADRAGLRAGDVVTAVDDEGVDDIGELRHAIIEAGNDATLDVVRQGRRMELQLGDD